MDWFSILKEQRQVARNVQSFKPIQVDKPFTIPDEEESCYQQLLEYIDSKFERLSFHNGMDDVFFQGYKGEGKFQGRLIRQDIHDNLYCLIRQQVDEFITNIDRLDNNAPPTALVMHGLKIQQNKYFGGGQVKKPLRINLSVTKIQEGGGGFVLSITSRRVRAKDYLKSEEENS